LSEAREALSQLTAMPEAARLQGEARTQVSQLISSFNALIATKSDWRAAYAKVDTDLTTLIGPDAGDRAVGTSGRPEATDLDPALRAKLVEFRAHMNAFVKAAGGGPPSSESTAAAMTPGGDAPARSATPPPAATVSAPPDSPSPATSAKSDENALANGDARKELDAISAILGDSKTGGLTPEQTAQLKQHVEALRALLKDK
jgi:hypothetical protein